METSVIFGERPRGPSEVRPADQVANLQERRRLDVNAIMAVAVTAQKLRASSQRVPLSVSKNRSSKC
jgi:hypothetical protein